MRKNIIKLVVIITAIIIIGIIIYNLTKKEEIPIVVNVSKIDNYEYTLKTNSTEIYKTYYKELEKVLNNDPVDEQEYVKLISKLYIIDFYTLKNKVTNQDVGGLEFIHTKIKDNFYSKAVNTIYKYIENNLYNNRNQSLPEVRDVEIINVEEKEYDEDDIKDEKAYQVEVKTSFVKDMGYKNHLKLLFVHEENKLSLIESIEL